MHVSKVDGSDHSGAEVASERSGSDGSTEFAIVANRLPVRMGSGGAWEISPGGLVSALLPVMRGSGGSWLGWSGELDNEAGRLDVDGLDLADISLSERDYEEYYCEFSNRVLWPLFHDAVRKPPFEESSWEGYTRVNRRFAERAAEVMSEGGVVWIQDYHLLMMPGYLRSLRPDLRIGLFLHIPVPPVELFSTIPWREELTDSLLEVDLIGTQTPKDAEHMRSIVTAGDRFHERKPGVRTPGVEIRSFPISIDTKRFVEGARAAGECGAVDDLKESLAGGRFMYLGVDRLDYTKGIDLRLRAFERALESGSIDASKVCFVQVAVPSRESVDDYQEISECVDMLVGRINGRFGGVNGAVVHYIKESLGFDDLIALYRAADVMVVTPVRDGMNLVAKEYVATRFDGSGELILSEFAGASRELAGATIVNPHDEQTLGAAMASAFVNRASGHSCDSMKAMHEHVKVYDVNHWAKAFIDHLRGSGHDGEKREVNSEVVSASALDVALQNGMLRSRL